MMQMVKFILVEKCDQPSKSCSDILHLLSPPAPDQVAAGSWQAWNGAWLGVPVVRVSAITFTLLWPWVCLESPSWSQESRLMKV